jgi:hypothetical protein
VRKRYGDEWAAESFQGLLKPPEERFRHSVFLLVTEALSETGEARRPLGVAQVKLFADLERFTLRIARPQRNFRR